MPAIMDGSILATVKQITATNEDSANCATVEGVSECINRLGAYEEPGSTLRLFGSPSSKIIQGGLIPPQRNLTSLGAFANDFSDANVGTLAFGTYVVNGDSSDLRGS
jgi:hypothetical protein